MRVVVIGTGYVGLVSGACLADFGHIVTCVDKDTAKIATLTRHEIPIYEPGLKELVEGNVRAGRLSFTTSTVEAVPNADVVLIAVGTPSRPGDGRTDLTYVHAAAREVAASLKGFTVVVTKSTVPVGTGDEVERIIREARPQLDFAVASNPSFCARARQFTISSIPDRIVVGSEDERAAEVMAELYRPLFLNAAPVLNTDRRTAELIKYASNALLATKITFINEVADLCEKVGADVQSVARGIGLDKRIGSKFLHAGTRLRRFMFPKDTVALTKTGQDHDARRSDRGGGGGCQRSTKRAMARRVAAAVGGDVRGKTVAVLGLAFKPNTDDVREAPSLALITALQDMGAVV